MLLPVSVVEKKQRLFSSLKYIQSNLSNIKLHGQLQNLMLTVFHIHDNILTNVCDGVYLG